MNRVVVVGCSGSGKTTVATEIATRLGLPHLEMDAVAHRDGWDSTPVEEFQEVLDHFTSSDRWVVDGNYASRGAPEVVWPRADTLVWLDLPKRVVMKRVVRRTLKRVLTREELWNGMREPFSNLYSLDPYENLVVWTWTRYDRYEERYGRAIVDGTWEHATVYRLRSRGETRNFLASIADDEPGLPLEG